MAAPRRAEKARKERERNFARILWGAHRAGLIAVFEDFATAPLPRPGLWQNPFKHKGMVDERSGIAWIRIRCDNPFAVWASLRVGLYANRESVEFFVFLFNRSYERKTAYARGFAQFLTDSGIPATSTSTCFDC
jgi:hypothetical protein